MLVHVFIFVTLLCALFIWLLVRLTSEPVLPERKKDDEFVDEDIPGNHH